MLNLKVVPQDDGDANEWEQWRGYVDYTHGNDGAAPIRLYYSADIQNITIVFRGNPEATPPMYPLSEIYAWPPISNVWGAVAAVVCRFQATHEVS